MATLAPAFIPIEKLISSLTYVRPVPIFGGPFSFTPHRLCINWKRSCLNLGMTIKELAEKIDIKGPNLSNKLARYNFSEKVLQQIAESLDCDFEGSYSYKNLTVIN